MESKTSSQRLVSPEMITAGFPGWLSAIVNPPLAGLLGFRAINRLHQQTADQSGPREFCEAVLRRLSISVHVAASDVDKIPATGPLIVVANHPYGAVDALAVLCLLLSRRPDVKVMANYLLARIPAMRSLLVRVDPFGGEAARAANFGGMRESLRWLAGGGALVTFPSGTVAHLDIARRAVTEPPWSDHIARLARHGGAAILPVFVSGRNSALFQVAGLIHPVLRTALLGREVVNKRRHRFSLAVGHPIGADQLPAGLDDREVIELLRRRTYAMRHRAGLARRTGGQPRRRGWLARRRAGQEPVAEPIDTPALEADLAALSDDALLCRCGEYRVVLARSEQIPRILLELGRLREIAFRTVGEGIGRARDLDAFDAHYRHLFVWNDGRRELVGAYRLGLTDEIVARRGYAGLYTASLFRIAPEFFERIAPAIELGRSFVRPEYQRCLSPLMLLWKGIGQFIACQPRYRHLFGAVSISDRYSVAARQLLVDHLSQPFYRSPLAEWVQPMRPFDAAMAPDAELRALATSVGDIDQLDRIISDIEPDGKGVPILIRQYLRLGARTLAFSVDPTFNYCLDCFCCFDLLDTQLRTMERYMGRQQSRTFLAAHGRWVEGDGGGSGDGAAREAAASRLSSS